MSEYIDCSRIIKFEALLVTEDGQEVWHKSEFGFDSKLDPEYTNTHKMLTHLEDEGLVREIAICQRSLEDWLI